MIGALLKCAFGAARYGLSAARSEFRLQWSMVKTMRAVRSLQEQFPDE